MSIRIDIDGLDSLKKELVSMERGLKFETIDFWCKRIANDVKLKAPADLAERLLIEAVPNAEGNLEIKFSSPLELVSLIVEIVKMYLTEMPITTRALFEKVIRIIEEKEKGGS
jgi:hypothetical protein